MRSGRSACSRSSSAECSGRSRGCGRTRSPSSTRWPTAPIVSSIPRKPSTRRPCRASPTSPPFTHSQGSTDMEVLLLAIYSLFVWLIFFKFKWLAWTTTAAVIVVTIPIFALAGLILLLNVFAPSALDGQVVKEVVQVLPRVTGRVIEVPVEPNRLTRKGDVLFRIDPRPFEYEVQRLDALLSATRAGVAAQGDELRAAEAQIDVSISRVASIESSIEATRVRLKLAEMRQTQTQQLAAAGAGD